MLRTRSNGCAKQRKATLSLSPPPDRLVPVFTFAIVIAIMIVIVIISVHLICINTVSFVLTMLVLLTCPTPLVAAVFQIVVVS